MGISYKDETSRIVKIGDAISQLINVTLFPRHKDTNANESVSGRSHREGWIWLENIINFLFSPIEDNHCEMAYKKDIQRSKSILGID